jgi:hypothetical protein
VILPRDNRRTTAHKPGMDPNKSALERAFELAKSGAVKSVADLRTKVSREGYSASQLDGAALGRQLRNLINKAAGPEAE